jgi:hypothetical protein
LPTLEKRYHSRPDLYRDSICPRCRKEEETLEHLIECPVNRKNWKSFDNKLKEKLENLGKNKDLTPVQRKEIRRLLFSENLEVQQSQSQDYIRGIIRKDTILKLQLLDISRKKVKMILVEFLEEWFHYFKEIIWNTRCNEIIQWEKEKGITKKEKRKKRKSQKKKDKVKEGKKARKKEDWNLATSIAFKEVDFWIHQGYHHAWNMQ